MSVNKLLSVQAFLKLGPFEVDTVLVSKFHEFVVELGGLSHHPSLHGLERHPVLHFKPFVGDDVNELRLNELNLSGVLTIEFRFPLAQPSASHDGRLRSHPVGRAGRCCLEPVLCSGYGEVGILGFQLRRLGVGGFKGNLYDHILWRLGRVGLGGLLLLCGLLFGVFAVWSVKMVRMCPG